MEGLIQGSNEKHLPTEISINDKTLSRKIMQDYFKPKKKNLME